MRNVFLYKNPSCTSCSLITDPPTRKDAKWCPISSKNHLEICWLIQNQISDSASSQVDSFPFLAWETHYKIPLQYLYEYIFCKSRTSWIIEGELMRYSQPSVIVSISLSTIKWDSIDDEFSFRRMGFTIISPKRIPLIMLSMRQKLCRLTKRLSSYWRPIRFQSYTKMNINLFLVLLPYPLKLGESSARIWRTIEVDFSRDSHYWRRNSPSEGNTKGKRSFNQGNFFFMQRINCILAFFIEQGSILFNFFWWFLAINPAGSEEEIKLYY